MDRGWMDDGVGWEVDVILTVSRPCFARVWSKQVAVVAEKREKGKANGAEREGGRGGASHPSRQSI